MKTELPQDSPVCFHDFSVADESIAWSSCSSAGLASSSIHGAKLTLSLESTSFRLHNVALRFGIYMVSVDYNHDILSLLMKKAWFRGRRAPEVENLMIKFV